MVFMMMGIFTQVSEFILVNSHEIYKLHMAVCNPDCIYIMYCFLQFKYFPSVSEEITADLTKPKTPIRDDWYHNGLVNMVYFGFM